jgi:hypothetical protein
MSFLPFPCADFNPLLSSPHPALLSSSSFQHVIQQLFQVFSALFAHQHALSLLHSDAASSSNAKLSYADVLKSDSSLTPKRPSFTVRQITPITPCPHPPCNRSPPSPRSSPAVVYSSPPIPPAPVNPISHKSNPSVSVTAPSVINFSTPAKVSTTAPECPSKPSPSSTASPSRLNPDSAPFIPVIQHVIPTVDLPMDPLSVSMRNQYPPVTALCSFCKIYPADNVHSAPRTKLSCIPCLFRLLPSDYDDSMKKKYGISRREYRFLDRFKEEFRATLALRFGNYGDDDYRVGICFESDRKSIWTPGIVKYRELFLSSDDDPSDVWRDVTGVPLPATFVPASESESESDSVSESDDSS